MVLGYPLQTLIIKDISFKVHRRSKMKLAIFAKRKSYLKLDSFLSEKLKTNFALRIIEVYNISIFALNDILRKSFRSISLLAVNSYCFYKNVRIVLSISNMAC